MITTVSDLHVFPLFALLGVLLGILGFLYITYDLFGRQSEILHKLSFALSYSFIFVFIIFISSLFFIAPKYRIIGYLSPAIWGLIALYGSAVCILQFITLPPIPQIRPSGVDWLRLILWGPLIGFGLVRLGVHIIYPDSSFLKLAMFALPGTLIIGLLSSFSSAIQWRISRLPEKHVAAIGALLILCAFALIFVPPLFGFLGM
ncbi:MAG: hypothetical protein ABI234_06810 [Ktedonobacteraceae bacterium]